MPRLLTLCVLFCLLGCHRPVSGQAQPGFMPTIDGSNVMLGAVLHESSKKVVFDAESLTWRVTVEVQPMLENTFVLPLLLDQSNVSYVGKSLNWISDPRHSHWQYVCALQDFLVSTRYVNYDVTVEANNAGDCWQGTNDAKYAAMVTRFDDFRHITYGGVEWVRDGLIYNISIRDTEAERYGWAYEEADGLRVLDFRFMMLFVRFSSVGSTYVEILYVPFQSVLLRDARTWGSGFQKYASDCQNVYQKPDLASYVVRKDDYVAGLQEYCDWYCKPGFFMYPQHAAWRQRNGESSMDAIGSECKVPFEYGIVVGLSAWLFLDMNRSMEEAGIQDILPRYWNMSIPRMGWWLDEMVSRRMERSVRDALTFFRPYEVLVMTEFHDQQYAEEWRLYMQSLRGLYEELTNQTVKPAVNIHSNLSQYQLPNWMQDLGVFTMNNLDYYGVPNTTWLENYRVGNQAITTMDVVALEMVIMIGSDKMDMLMLTDIIQQAFQDFVASSNGSVFSAETLLRDMTVRPLLPTYQKDWRMIYFAVITFGVSLLCLFFMCISSKRSEQDYKTII